MWFWWKDRQINPWNRRLRDRFTPILSLDFLTKMPKQLNGESEKSLTNGAETNEYPYKKQRTLTLCHTLHKINLRWTIDLKVKVKTENRRISLWTKDFLERTQSINHKGKKMRKWTWSKLKHLLIKKHHPENKQGSHKMRRYSQHIYLTKDLCPEYINPATQ